jgi:bis(5'-nucleosidyl)-tetraphosphatase
MDHLRSYVREVMSKVRPKSAGIILVRRFEDGPRILGLRRFSSYDLPKGHIETGEDALTAAVRETEEESSVTSISFPWGYVHTDVAMPHKDVILFIGETDQDGALAKNPESGRWEHHGLRWLSLDEALEADFGRLGPAVEWAVRIVKDNDSVNLS